MSSIFSKTRSRSRPAGVRPLRSRSRRKACLPRAFPLRIAADPARAASTPSCRCRRRARSAGIEEPNLRAPEAVAAAIRSALDEVSPRTRAVTLVLPDTLVRVFVLDFDSLPAKAAEAVPVVRFRLRKMVPFDVEHAGVSYQVLDAERIRVQSAGRRRARAHPRRVRSRRARRGLRARRGPPLQPGRA